MGERGELRIGGKVVAEVSFRLGVGGRNHFLKGRDLFVFLKLDEVEEEVAVAFNLWHNQRLVITIKPDELDLPEPAEGASTAGQYESRPSVAFAPPELNQDPD